MLSVWLLLALAWVLSGTAAWVLVAGWRDDRRRARAASLRAPEPERGRAAEPPAGASVDRERL